MKKILLSFCGTQDPLNKIGDDGPILSLLARMPDFHSLILFHTKDHNAQAKSTQKTVASRYPQMDAKTINLPDLVDATNHEQIFNSLRPKLAELCPIQPDIQYYICNFIGHTGYACLLVDAGCNR